MFKELGVEPHRQMNEKPLLTHLKYRIVHYDSPDVGYQIILDAIRDGDNVVIACAEQTDLEALDMYLLDLFHDLQHRKVDRTVSGDKRKAVLLKLTR